MTAAGVDPGLELAIACAGGDATAVCEAARGVADWPSALGVIEGQGIQALAFQALTAAGDAVPAPALQELREASALATRSSVFQAAELLRLIRMFDDGAIGVVPVRGPVLADLVYGRIDLRPCADLDLLVHRRDVDKAEAVLAAAGYRPEQKLGRVRARWLRVWDCERSFESDRGLHVELHWRLFPVYMGFSMRESDVWARSGAARFLGHPVRVLSPEDTIVMLCLHNGGKHLWWTLRWIVDFAMYMRDRDVDWGGVRERAARAGCARAVLVGLGVVDGLLHRSPPGPLRADVAADRTAVAVASAIVDRLLHGAAKASWGFKKTLLYLRMRERWRDRVLYIGRIIVEVVVPIDLAAPRQSLAAKVLLAPVRVLGLVLKYAGLAARRQLPIISRRKRGSASKEDGHA